MSRIVIIDDDMAMDILTENLRIRGHDAKRLRSAEEAIANKDELASADLVILDVIMSWPEGRDRLEMSCGQTAGMEVFRELRAVKRELPILVYSATADQSIIGAITDDEHASFISKWNSHSIRELVERIHRMLNLPIPGIQPQVFIVHGHDVQTLLEVKNYLQNTLHLPEPTVLREKPSLGRTIIEKFEDHASRADVVLVILTPDDVGATVEEPNDVKRRARQNVIFEMGYFIGVLGRLSGRVLLLHKGPLELPSDLLGVIYVDITGSVEAAGETLRKEFAHVLS